MTQFVVSAVGAAIGFVATGGSPTGAQVGWMIGSMVGGAAAPRQKITGPRLSDLKVMGVEYGQPIPWFTGSVRVPGQIWWASDRREIATTTEQGKGGGPEYTEFTYEVDLLIGLTDVPIEAVGRVWMNGKVVWSALAATGADGLLASTNNTNWTRMSVLRGGDTQLPDPTYEAAVGTANAPAYRGRGAVFIEALQLGTSGQLPNLTFEIVSSVSAYSGNLTTFGRMTIPSGWTARTGCLYVDDDGNVTAHLPNWRNGYPGREVIVTKMTPQGVQTSVRTYNQDGDYYDYAHGYADEDANIAPTATTGTYKLYRASGTTSIAIPGAISYGGSQVRFALKDGIVVVASQGFGDKKIHIYDATTGVRSASSGAQTYYTKWLAIGATEIYALEQVSSGTPNILKLNPTTLATEATIAPPPTATTLAASHIYVNESGNLIIEIGSGNGAYSNKLYEYVSGSWVVFNSDITGAEGDQPGAASAQTYLRGALYLFDSSSNEEGYIRVSVPAITAGTETLRATVEDLCTRGGLTASQVDASSLASITTPVRGMLISQVSPVRSALETLAQAYGFSAVLSDKLYFRPRASASTRTIAYDDLGTGADTVGEPFEVAFANDYEMIPRIAVSYVNATADYNTDTQYSDRVTSAQVATEQLDLPLIFTASEAKAIADKLVADSWASRARMTLAVPLSYAGVEPSDAVTVVDGNARTWRVRLLKLSDDGASLKVDAVVDDITTQTSAGTTSTAYAASVIVVGASETTLELLDVPLLRDADDAPGHYLALSGDANWIGANAYDSLDGVTYNKIATSSAPAVLGTASTTLPNFTGGTVWDTRSTLTVNVGTTSTLSSSTRGTLLEDVTINTMLVGSEIIRFTTATLSSPGIYVLTDLLRGVLGTEWAISGHGASERVVLLETTTLRYVRKTEADIGVQRYYKSVTLGRALGDVASEQFTNTGISTKPLAPVDLRASRLTSDDIALTWKRRTRYRPRFCGTAGIAVPLGETSERYEVEIWTSGYAALKRTITATSSLATYTGVQQQLDFSTAQTTLYVRVYQLNGNGDRGRVYAATVTVDVLPSPPAPPAPPPDGDIKRVLAWLDPATGTFASVAIAVANYSEDIRYNGSEIGMYQIAPPEDKAVFSLAATRLYTNGLYSNPVYYADASGTPGDHTLLALSAPIDPYVPGSDINFPTYCSAYGNSQILALGIEGSTKYEFIFDPVDGSLDTQTAVTLSPTTIWDGAAVPHTLVYFNSAWHAFGENIAVYFYSRSGGGTWTRAADTWTIYNSSAYISVRSSVFGAAVLGSHLYVGLLRINGSVWGGVILRTSDGTTWTEVWAGTINTLTTQSNGSVVAATVSGLLGGVNSSTRNNLLPIGTGLGFYFADSTGRYVIKSSADGLTWTKYAITVDGVAQTSDLGDMPNIEHVVSTGTYQAARQYKPTTDALATIYSSNGFNFTTAASAVTGYASVAGDMYKPLVAAGNLILVERVMSAA